jgi:hypothetical protein
MLREALARAVYWLKGLRSEERHRRMTAEALCGSHRPDVTPAEQQELAEHAALVHRWKTGEFPTVTFDHPEPIGPREPVPALYASLLAESRPWMSQDVLDKLEGPTGCWRVGDLAEMVERAKR